jgi:two-component system C4-dicarboxylate transport response regulator DctD
VLGVSEEGSGFDRDPGVTPDAASLPQQLDAYERMLIAEALAASNGNVALTAEHLGLPKKTLYDKLKKYHLATGRAIEG